VIVLTGRFLQYYRENANWLERTYSFVPRVGIERHRELIVDDSEGLGEGLDARIEAAIGACRDPWQEGQQPAVPGQFRTALPLRSLPLVPVRTVNGNEHGPAAAPVPAAGSTVAGLSSDDVA
jgi:nitrite reductase (NADH) large subunit